LNTLILTFVIIIVRKKAKGVVNAGYSKGDAVFVYDLTCKTLYYHAKSKMELKEY